MKLRLIPFMLFVAAFVAGCMGDDGGTHLALPGRGPVLSPFIAGLWGTPHADEQQSELDAYLRWFRGSPGSEPPGPSNGLIDPSCPLQYAYQEMANTGWYEHRDGLYMTDEANADDGKGFYNPSRQEALILLKGSPLGTRVDCTPDDPVYLPVRINLTDGRWSIEGYTSPAATIQITINAGLEMVPLASARTIDGNVPSIVSPLRLSRFQVTDENWSRVMSYATLNRSGQGMPRRIVWFRTSDISPNYAHLAEGSACNAGFFAFWGKTDSSPAAPCGADQVDSFTESPGPASTMFLDTFARMSGGGQSALGLGDTYDVVDKADDDGAICVGSLSADACNQIWQQVTPELAELTVKSTSIDRRRSIIDELRIGFQAIGWEDLNAPPASLGGWDGAASDPTVFGVIASGGRAAFDDTMRWIGSNDAPALQPLIGYVGLPINSETPPGRSTTITLSPSFDYDQVKSDEALREFYNEYSLLMNTEGTAFDVMSFSTSANGSVLEYEQSPLTKITITVADSLNTANQANYSTNWLPLQAIYRNAGDGAIRQGIDLLADFGGAVKRAISDLIWGIYRATFGNFMASLSKTATENLLALPTLEPYQISRLRTDSEGNLVPIYAVNTALIHIDHYFFTQGQLTLDPTGLSDTEYACTYIAYNGNLSDIGQSYWIEYLGRNFPVDECLLKNDMFTLYQAVRGLALLLLILLAGRYFINLARGSDREIGLLPFFTRFVFCIALIVGMDYILKTLALITGETILITNLIGTQMNDGVPYSHLWLFSAYLNSPTRDMNPFALILLAPFSIIGILVLLLFNWLRWVMTIAIVVVSPLWVASLLADPYPKFFYTSLRYMVRMYLIPLIALVFMLVLFVVAKMLGLSTNTGGDLTGAIVGMVMMIALGVVPFTMSPMIISGVMRPIEATIQGFVKAEREEKQGTLFSALEGNMPMSSDRKLGYEPGAQYQSGTPGQISSADLGGYLEAKKGGSDPSRYHGASDAQLAAESGGFSGGFGVPADLVAYRAGGPREIAPPPGLTEPDPGVAAAAKADGMLEVGAAWSAMDVAAAKESIPRDEKRKPSRKFRIASELTRLATGQPIADTDDKGVAVRRRDQLLQAADALLLNTGRHVNYDTHQDLGTLGLRGSFGLVERGTAFRDRHVYVKRLADRVDPDAVNTKLVERRTGWADRQRERTELGATWQRSLGNLNEARGQLAVQQRMLSANPNDAAARTAVADLQANIAGHVEASTANGLAYLDAQAAPAALRLLSPGATLSQRRSIQAVRQQAARAMAFGAGDEARLRHEIRQLEVRQADLLSKRASGQLDESGNEELAGLETVLAAARGNLDQAQAMQRSAIESRTLVTRQREIAALRRQEMVDRQVLAKMREVEGHMLAAQTTVAETERAIAELRLHGDDATATDRQSIAVLERDAAHWRSEANNHARAHAELARSRRQPEWPAGIDRPGFMK